MGIIVQKFVGTPVANIDRIKSVAKLVKKEINLGNKTAVVSTLAF